jgi:hypothetical protein
MKIWASVAYIGYGHATKAMALVSASPSRCEDRVPGHRRHRRAVQLQLGAAAVKRHSLAVAAQSLAGTDLFSDIGTRWNDCDL